MEIGPGTGRVYSVAVVRSVAGEVREQTQLPFDDLALENQLLTLQNALLRSGGKSRHILLPEEQSVQDFGRTLFTTLFTGAIGHLYAVSQREAALQGKGLRLKLRLLAPEMAALPWEFLYDPSRAEYICLRRPARTGVTLRTGDRLRLPIDGEVPEAHSRSPLDRSQS